MGKNFSPLRNLRGGLCLLIGEGTLPGGETNLTSDTLIGLLEQRSEQALRELDAAYGAYCRTIAGNILQSPEDAEECVSDAYLSVWNAIPPARPDHFKAWLGAIVRNAALRRRQQSARTAALQEELAESLPDGRSVAGQCEARALGEAISAFLRRQRPELRQAFLRRYWYADSLEAVALRMGWSVSKTKSALFRLRKQLKDYLMKEELWHE